MNKFKRLRHTAAESATIACNHLCAEDSFGIGSISPRATRFVFAVSGVPFRGGGVEFRGDL